MMGFPPQGSSPRLPHTQGEQSSPATYSQSPHHLSAAHQSVHTSPAHQPSQSCLSPASQSPGQSSALSSSHLSSAHPSSHLSPAHPSSHLPPAPQSPHLPHQSLHTCLAPQPSGCQTAGVGQQMQSSPSLSREACADQEVASMGQVQPLPSVAVAPGIGPEPAVCVATGIRPEPSVAVATGVGPEPAVSVAKRIGPEPLISMAPGIVSMPSVSVAPGVGPEPPVSVATGTSSLLSAGAHMLQTPAASANLSTSLAQHHPQSVGQRHSFWQETCWTQQHRQRLHVSGVPASSDGRTVVTHSFSDSHRHVTGTRGVLVSHQHVTGTRGVSVSHQQGPGTRCVSDSHQQGPGSREVSDSHSYVAGTRGMSDSHQHLAGTILDPVEDVSQKPQGALSEAGERNVSARNFGLLPDDTTQVQQPVATRSMYSTSPRSLSSQYLYQRYATSPQTVQSQYHLYTPKSVPAQEDQHRFSVPGKQHQHTLVPAQSAYAEQARCSQSVPVRDAHQQYSSSAELALTQPSYSSLSPHAASPGASPSPTPLLAGSSLSSGQSQATCTEVSSIQAQSCLPRLPATVPSIQAPGMGGQALAGQEGEDWKSGSEGQSHHHISAYHQYRLPPPEHSPSDILDKKPTLQVTTDHSPGGSPGSSTSSPRFVFPDMHRSSSSGHLASDSGSSPFMSPIKREVKWEVGTPPTACDQDLATQQLTQQSEFGVDSETGSSLLEESSSSREQSPFSAMAETLSLRSPSEHSPSPLAREVLICHGMMLASDDEEEEEAQTEGGNVGSVGHMVPQDMPGDGNHHPPKLFKKRLHERYVLSLKDCPGAVDKHRLKVEGEDEGAGVEPRRLLAKTERPESPYASESSLPKSPRRSSSDTDNVRSEVAEVGASSADEGDVFMEPKRVRTKTRPPSLHQQKEPLDLSRGNLYISFRSASGSLVDPELLSPSMSTRHFSPPSVFRSPHHHHHHRLPPHHQYSPHQGLLSPQQQQSQSPLCSVPEGGRIFNFNMPSPLEGAHSDSDLISPSPMSPRVFTFPPQGIMNPMAEVNRLAVSPRAPYTPPPPFLHSKGLGSPGALDIKFGETSGFCGKRSLSESDMTYLCRVCGQVFPTNDNLAKHMAKHLPTETVRSADNNKVHYCKVCNRSFSRSDMLTRHMRLHTGLKPYECGDCGQVFSRSDHLNTHRRTHTGEKPYRCPQCPYAACRRDMITRHMRTHVKRTSRRGRYLSVPDDGEGQKSGSVSSTEATDRESVGGHTDRESTGGHTCSVSTVDSVESECLPPSSTSTQPSYLGTSVDSLLSPDTEEVMSPTPLACQLPASPAHRPLGEGGDPSYERFLHYRKARNWSTTSLESVDSEEASLVREVFADEAELHGPASEDNKTVCRASAAGPHAYKDPIALDVQSLQSKCFISRSSTGSSGGSS